MSFHWEVERMKRLSYNKDTLSIPIHNTYTEHMYAHTHTHTTLHTQTDKSISRQDDFRALKDTTVGKLRQVGNNSLKEQADS